MLIEAYGKYKNPLLIQRFYFLLVKTKNGKSSALDELIISRFSELDRNRCSGSLLVWSIQVCVYTRSRGKDISSALGEAIVAYYSEEVFKTISK